MEVSLLWSPAETGGQNTHSIKDMENSSPLAETGVHTDLTEGGLHPKDIHDRAIVRKKVVGLRNKPIKLRNRQKNDRRV